MVIAGLQINKTKIKKVEVVILQGTAVEMNEHPEKKRDKNQEKEKDGMVRERHVFQLKNRTLWEVGDFHSSISMQPYLTEKWAVRSKRTLTRSKPGTKEKIMFDAKGNGESWCGMFWEAASFQAGKTMRSEAEGLTSQNFQDRVPFMCEETIIFNHHHHAWGYALAG